MKINLKNKTAWVFGGSKGIGRAIAIELAKAGASILLIARNKNALHKTYDELCTQQQQQHDMISIDMSKLDLLKSTLEEFSKKPTVFLAAFTRKVLEFIQESLVIL